LGELDKTLLAIRESPRFFPFEFEAQRLASLERFPYNVVYRIDETQITVVAIYHQSRDPTQWKNRL
jgi:plasmid stabilization system protein ParE